jgi:hypothetical protein
VLSCAIHSIGRSGHELQVTVIGAIIERGDEGSDVTDAAPTPATLNPVRARPTTGSWQGRTRESRVLPGRLLLPREL